MPCITRSGKKAEHSAGAGGARFASGRRCPGISAVRISDRRVPCSAAAAELIAGSPPPTRSARDTAARGPARQRPPAVLSGRRRPTALSASAARSPGRDRRRVTCVRADGQPRPLARHSARLRIRPSPHAEAWPPLRRAVQGAPPVHGNAVGGPLAVPHVDSDGHRLQCSRYIDRNPVLARMTDHPAAQHTAASEADPVSVVKSGHGSRLYPGNARNPKPHRNCGRHSESGRA